MPGLPVPERGEVPGAFIVGASVHACQWDVEQVYTNDGDTERIATLDSQLHAQVLADALNLETAHGLSMPAAYALVKGLVPALCDALQSCIDGLDGTPSAEEVAIVRSGLISFLSRLQEGFPTSA